MPQYLRVRPPARSAKAVRNGAGIEPCRRPLEGEASEGSEVIGPIPGMATIRDKMGHCLHGSFTIMRSQERALGQSAN
jgi:hypothetical protein